MQIHDLVLNHYKTLKAEDFIEEFQKLWDASFSGHKNIYNEQIKPDLLYFSIKMCKEKLPPLLEIPKKIDFMPENFLAFVLYEVSMLLKPK